MARPPGGRQSEVLISSLFLKENAMLLQSITQIISHTPLYVWGILALLVSRGVAASKEREMSIGKLAILPIAMLALSVVGIDNAFGFDGAAAAVWLVALAAGAALGWRTIDAAKTVACRDRASIVQGGSWLPLVLMMGVFCTKYAVGVMVAMSPALRHALPFVIASCALYGMFSGLFAGRLLRNLAIYHGAASGGTAAGQVA
jgi:hypothetical protein